jgi:hypothetical protein
MRRVVQLLGMHRLPNWAIDQKMILAAVYFPPKTINPKGPLKVKDFVRLYLLS